MDDLLSFNLTFTFDVLVTEKPGKMDALLNRAVVKRPPVGYIHMYVYTVHMYMYIHMVTNTSSTSKSWDMVV